jgi:signal transduction histidine kinase
MVANMRYHWLKALKNPHLWVVIFLFIIGIILHYPQQILGTDSASLFSFLGLSRHAVERIFLLLPLGYAGFFISMRAGLASLVIVTAVMLPRVFLISQYFADALFETIGVIVIGSLVILWIYYDRKRKEQKQQILSTLEESNRKLQSYSKALEINHRRLKETQAQVIQAEKLTSLGQLAASIADEINNPLSGVLVYTQLLARKVEREEADNDVTLDYLSKMEAELVRSTELIKNLLNFARQSTPEFQPVNLNTVVNHALDLVLHSVEEKDIRVFNELDPSLPEIMADSGQLQQVCLNLIINAIQAMPQGGRLTLRTYVQNSKIKLEVQDTGIGIPPENMEKLFTPFFSTKSDVKGVGLGLAVAYGIVHRHKGRIEAHSKEGEGSTFTVTMPMQPESPEKDS